MSKDWIFRTDKYICDLRTVGVLVRDGKLLVQRDRDGNEYALPGGHVKIGETTVDGLAREYKEETGAEIKVDKLLWTEECFWEWNGTKAHNIAFYYLIELCDGSDIPDCGEFVSHKDNCDVVLGWMPIEKLADVTIYPDFIKETIHELDAAPRHFITGETETHCISESPNRTIMPYDKKYRDDMIFMVLEAKNALGRIPKLNEDLLDIQSSYLDKGDMFWLAIDENDRVIGCIGYNSISGTTEVMLHRLYVKAVRKRQGIGTALLHTAERYLREQGKTAALVHLGGRDYFESRSFYPKHGYVEYAPSMMKKEL